MRVSVTLSIVGASNGKVNMHVGEMQIEESDDEKLLNLTLEKKLRYKKHFQTLCKNASQKLHALSIYI